MPMRVHGDWGILWDCQNRESSEKPVSGKTTYHDLDRLESLDRKEY
jgi:hypothetical protein